MFCIIRLTFWSLPLIWVAIAILAVAVAYLYHRLYHATSKTISFNDLADILRFYESLSDDLKGGAK